MLKKYLLLWSAYSVNIHMTKEGFSVVPDIVDPRPERQKDSSFQLSILLCDSASRVSLSLASITVIQNSRGPSTVLLMICGHSEYGNDFLGEGFSLKVF